MARKIPGSLGQRLQSVARPGPLQRFLATIDDELKEIVIGISRVEAGADGGAMVAATSALDRTFLDPGTNSFDDDQAASTPMTRRCPRRLIAMAIRDSFEP